MAIKKMAAKKVVKKTAVKKPIAKKPIRKMQDGGKIDKLTKDKLKRAGVSKEEYTRVMNDNSKMPTRAAGSVTPALFDERNRYNNSKYFYEKRTGRLTYPLSVNEDGDLIRETRQIVDVKQGQPYSDEGEPTDRGVMRPRMKKGGVKKSTTKKVVMRKGGKITKGMGFKAAQTQIAAKQGISMERAGAILATGARKASPAAKRKNPNLKKVKMKK